MWGSFESFAQIKKRTKGFGRRRREFFGNINFGNEHQYNNGGWSNYNNNGGNANNNWGNQNNYNNDWGNENNNNGWGNQEGGNGWGNQGGNQGGNGWGNQGGNQGGNGWENQGGSLWGNSLNGIQWVSQMQKHQGNISGFQFNDIKKFVQNQIILIEPSPHKKLLEQLKKNGQVFKDDRFPPTQKSLTGQWGFVSEWKDIKWTPISQGLPNSKIFQGKIEPGDISQGYLGDCYFLAALAALAERPDRIFQLFLLTETNEQKYYSVKILYKGKWMTIDMDEHVPFLHGKPAFTKAKENQLWVILLEKAWAKLYSSFKRIEAGYPEQGLHDLTGAPVRQIVLQSATFDREKQWKYLVDASQRQYPMVSSSQPGSDTNKSVSGVVQGHAYTFLNATHLNFQGQQIRIVQLRNPWGKGEFTGRWSDSDPNWNYVDASEKDRVGFNLNKEDGIFFMSWEDYCKEFRALTVCQVDDNASYIYKSYKDPYNKGCYFKVTIHKTGNYSFHVDKTPQRTLEDSKQNSFQYPQAEILIGNISGNLISGKKGTTSKKRTLYYDIDIQAGQYIVFVKINYDKSFEKDFDVNLAIYAEFPCEIALASTKEADLLAGRNTEWKGEQIKTQDSWNNMAGYGVLQTQGNNNSGWQQQGNNSSWEQSNNNWGQPNNTNNNGSGWGQQNSSGWEQPNNYGWGQQQGNNLGWGQQQGSNSGWGQENKGGWGNQGSNGW